MTALGLRWVSPFGIFPAGQDPGQAGGHAAVPALGEPGGDAREDHAVEIPHSAHQLLRGLHQPRRSRDRELRIPVRHRRPAGRGDKTASGEAVVAADEAAVAAAGMAAAAVGGTARALPTVAITATVTAATEAPIAAASQPRPIRRAPCSLQVIASAFRDLASGGGRRRLLGRPWRRIWLPFPGTVSLRVLPIGVVRAGASGKPVPEGAHHDGALASHFLRSVGCHL